MNDLTLNPSKTPDKPPKLKPKHRKFADSVLAGENLTQSARMAGYKSKYLNNQAYDLSVLPCIKQYLDFHYAQLAKEYEITTRDTVPYLRHARDVSMKTDDMNNMIKATTELAKIGGQYNESQSINTRPAFVGISINMGDKPSIELIEKRGPEETDA